MSQGRTAEMVMTVAARFGGKAINLLAFLVVARQLSLDELGLYGFVFSTALLIATAFDFGVRNSVAYFVGKRPNESRAFAVQSLLLWIPCALGAVGGLYVTLAFSPGSLIDPRYFLPSGILVVSMLFLRMQQGVLLGAGRIKFYNATELASRLVLLVTTIGLLALDLIRLDTALWSLALSQLAAALFLARGVLATAVGGKGFEWALSRELLSRGILFMLGVVLMLASKRLAILLLSQLGTAEEMGVFFGLQRLTEVLTEIGLAVAVVVFSNSVRADSTAVAIDHAAHSTRVSFTLFVAMSLVMFVGADLLIPFALGGDFAGHGELFRVILLATLAGSVWTILFPSLSAVASPLLPFMLFLPHLLVNLLLIWFLYGSMGMVGAAWALVILNVGLTATFLVTFRLRYGVRVRDFLIPRRSDLDVAAMIRKLRRGAQQS